MPISKQSSHLLWYWCMHTVTLLSKHQPVVNSCNNYVYHHTCGFMNSRLSVDVSALQVWTYWITPSESSWRYKYPAFPTYRGCMLQFQQEMKILMHVISPLLVQWMRKYITMSAQLHCVLWHTWGHPYTNCMLYWTSFMLYLQSIPLNTRKVYRTISIFQKP